MNEISDDEAFDTSAVIKKTRAFIQWKGTDACMDFHCECGQHCHIDSYFVYSVECPGCKTIWEMPIHLFPRKQAKDSTNIVFKPEPDDI